MKLQGGRQKSDSAVKKSPEIRKWAGRKEGRREEQSGGKKGPYYYFEKGPLTRQPEEKIPHGANI